MRRNALTAERHGLNLALPLIYLPKKNSLNSVHSFHNFCSTNLIRNPSGNDGFKDWNISEEGFEIETPLIGIPAIAVNDPHFENLKTSAFTSSNDWSTMTQKIDLWKIGLIAQVMRRIRPFQFTISFMVRCELDRGAKYKIRAFLESGAGEKCIQEMLIKGVCNKKDGWAQVTCVMSINERSSNWNHLDTIRYFVLSIKGKDTMFWKGDFKIKFSRISVTLQCVLPKEDDEESRQVKLIRSIACDLDLGEQKLINLDLANFEKF